MRAPAEAHRAGAASSSRVLCARRARRAGRARHLAARAQGLEGSADRRARPQARRAAGQPAAARALAAARRRRRTNSAASRFRPSFSPIERGAGLYRAARRCARTSTGPGYWVFAPARLTGGSIVVVNRGFVPEGRQDPKTRRKASPPASSRSSACCAGRSSAARSRRRMSRRQEPLVRARSGRDGGGEGLGRRRAVLRRSGGAAPPGGLPKVGPLKASLPNNHLQYAVTWYGLALVILDFAACCSCARGGRGTA